MSRDARYYERLRLRMLALGWQDDAMLARVKAAEDALWTLASSIAAAGDVAPPKQLGEGKKGLRASFRNRGA